MLNVTANNNQKYQSGNPLKRLLIGRFLDHIAHTLNHLQPGTVLDFGCGSAIFWQELQSRLQPWPSQLIGLDVDGDAISQARARNLPNARFISYDGKSLPEIPEPIDCITSFEVFEHLEQPQVWIESLCAIPAKHLLLSVPNEPWFRIAQMASGKNWSRLGNDIDHVQNWSASAFRQFLDPYVNILSVSVSAFPFTIVLGSPRQASLRKDS